MIKDEELVQEEAFQTNEWLYDGDDLNPMED